MRTLSLSLTCLLIIQISILTFINGGGSDPSGIGVRSLLSDSMIIVAQDGTGNYTTIQGGVDAASDGDTVWVYDGVYKEAVHITRSINLMGNGTAKTHLDGDNVLDHQHLFHISTNKVNVTGFNFREGSPHHEFAGIGIYGSGCVIDGNNFYDNTQGIYVAGGPDNIISNNTFDTNGYGIRSDMGSHGNFIINNTFRSNTIGGIIYMGARDVVISKNEFRGNRYHLSLFNSNFFEIGRNYFTDTDPGRAGLTIGSSADNLIHNNTFEENDIGLGMSTGADRNLVLDNTFRSNMEGIRAYATINNIEVHRNSFIGNTDWGMNCSRSSAPINGINNWWGNYTGPYHPTGNPSGTGDNVSDNVTFIPWMIGEFVNRAPSIDEIGDVFTVEDSPFAMRFNASDPDGHELSFRVTTDAEWLDFNSTSWNLTGIPDNLDVGRFLIRVNITDGWDGFDELSFNITVKNTPPAIYSENLPHAVEDIEYEFHVNHSIEEGAVWSCRSDAGWLEFDAENVSISGIPTNDDTRSFWIYLNISDGNGGYDEINLSLDVLPVDDLPEIMKPLENIGFLEDTEFYLDLSEWVVDVDTEYLNYSYTGRGNLSVVFDPIEHNAVIKPASNWSGYEMGNFTVHYNDTMLSQTVMIDVIPVNDAPTDLRIEIPSDPVTEGEIFAINGSAYDPDIPFGDLLTYSWSSNLSGFLGSSPTIYVNLTAGYHLITMNVSDRSGEGGSVSIDLVVMGIPGDDDNTITPDNDTDPGDNNTVPDDDNSTIPDDNNTVPDDDNTTDPDDDTVDDDDTTIPDDDDTDDEEVDDMGELLPYLIAGGAILLVLVLIAILFVRNKSGNGEELTDWDDEE
ncbi:MAG: pectinesterase family protein [Thermoplasmatota archaeon]